MNMLKNKKGFTLIEMLVVIAIIAVLVAIIIPTVSSATSKAKAAADAANLRSIVAEATTDLLGGQDDDGGLVKYEKAGDKFTANDTAPKSKTFPSATISITKKADGTLTAAYVVASGDDAGTYDLAAFAKVAEEGGKVEKTTSVTPTPDAEGKK